MASFQGVAANMPPEVIVAKLDALADAVAARIEREAEEANTAHGVFSIAVPGGSVATSFFPRLSRVTLGRIEVFQADERAVGPDDPDSNFALLSRLWLEPARIHAHRMRGESRDLDQAADVYASALPARLDAALLGVGPDGHIASLFPSHPALLEEQRRVVAVLDSPKPPPRRLTLTMPVLAGARFVIVAAMGAAKAAVMHQALHDPTSRLPVALLLRRCERALLLMDPAAAG